MLDHHLQRSIVYRLAFAPSLRFSELKPDNIESKLFDYHLKKVVSAGYASKQNDGTYALTPEGRRLGVHMLDKQHDLADRAQSVLFLVIRRKRDGAWLLYKRRTHPLLGKVGFMHGVPDPAMESTEAAHHVCRDKTGLVGEFHVLGSGFFRVYQDKELESFTHFTLLVCEDIRGELAEDDKYAEYFWDKNPNFSAPDMLPNMATLAELYNKNELFFVEKTLTI